MKSLLMTLMLLIGFAATQLSAQSSCTPCPPKCCVPSQCCKPGDSPAKCDVKACTPEQLKNCSTSNTGTTSAAASHNRPQPAKPIAARTVKQVATREN